MAHKKLQTFRRPPKINSPYKQAYFPKLRTLSNLTPISLFNNPPDRMELRLKMTGPLIYPYFLHYIITLYWLKERHW